MGTPGQPPGGPPWQPPAGQPPGPPSWGPPGGVPPPWQSPPDDAPPGQEPPGESPRAPSGEPPRDPSGEPPRDPSGEPPTEERPTWEPPTHERPGEPPTEERPAWQPPTHGGQGQGGWAPPAWPPPADPRSQPPGWQQPAWPPPGHPGAAPPPVGQLASYGQRVGASLIDHLILLGFVLVVTVLSAIVSGGDGEVAGAVVYLSWFAGVLLLKPLAYNAGLMAREGEHNGQTIGKQALGIRVIMEDGSAISYGPGVLREFAGKTLLFNLLAIFTFWVATLVNYFWPLWDDREQALHDKLASTLVVQA